MPQLIPLAIGALAYLGAGAALGSGVLFSIGSFAITGGMVAGLVGAIVSTAASFAMSMIMRPKAQQPPNPTIDAQDRKQTIRSTVEPRKVIYGEAKVGGTLAFAGSAGADLENLYLAIVLAGHPCHSIDAVFIGDIPIGRGQINPDGSLASDHSLAGKCRVWLYHGNQTTADPTLNSVFVPASSPPPGAPAGTNVLDASLDPRAILAKYGRSAHGGWRILSSDEVAGLNPNMPNSPGPTPYAGGWTGDHKLLGCTYIVVELTYDRDKFPNGLQNISAVVRGKNNIWDPRSNTFGYSNNWALCILDYLRGDHGLACADDEIDLPFFTAAANLSDEAVPLNADASVTQPRYRLNGAFSLDRAPLDLIEAMLGAGAGTMVYVQGRYRLHGGAYSAPTVSIGPGDFAGPVRVMARPPRRELFNAVRGTFVDPARSWQAAEFPAIYDAAFDAEDGERIWRDLPLSFTTDATMAQRLARIALLTGRDSVRFTAPMRYAALRLAVWQMVSVTWPDLGWSAKPFRVESWKFEPSTGEIEVSFREENAANYAWIWENAASIPPIPDTALIDALLVPPVTGLTITATTVVNADGSILPALDLVWDATPHPFVTAYEVMWWEAGAEATARTLTVNGATRARLVPVVSGVNYAVRVRAVAQLARGPWSGTGTRIAQQDTTPPGAITSFSAAGALRAIQLQWVNPADADLADVEIQERIGAGGWSTVAFVRGTSFLRENVPPGQARSYRARARDTSGNLGALSGESSATALAAARDDLGDGIVATEKMELSAATDLAIATMGGDVTVSKPGSGYSVGLLCAITVTVPAASQGRTIIHVDPAIEQIVSLTIHDGGTGSAGGTGSGE